jgi:2-keto-3-deoxy-6-phosphogluconate aldolase
VFGVSPGLTPALIEASRKSSGLPLLPGVMTPSEVMAAREAGFRQLKLFPAVPAGGVGMLNAHRRSAAGRDVLSDRRHLASRPRRNSWPVRMWPALAAPG